MYSDISLEESIAGPGFHFDIFDEDVPERIPDAIWENCDAVVVWHRMKITRQVLSKLQACKLIIRVGAGFDNVDIDACRDRGIPVSNVPNYGTTEVADHAIALLLYLVRGLGTYEAAMRADLVAGFVAETAPVVRRIRGATFGCVGMGRIGTAIARRAAAFDLNVVYFDPYLPEGHELGVGVRRVRSLAALVGESDIVSLHTPLNRETTGMINERTLADFKDGSILINIARGGLVDVDAVERALRSGKLTAAGLDVLPKEPPSPAPELLTAWQAGEAWLKGRLIVTPHSAFYSQAGYHDMRSFAIDVLVAYLRDNQLRNNVNPGWEARRPA